MAEVETDRTAAVDRDHAGRRPPGGAPDARGAELSRQGEQGDELVSRAGRRGSGRGRRGGSGRDRSGGGCRRARHPRGRGAYLHPPCRDERCGWPSPAGTPSTSTGCGPSPRTTTARSSPWARPPQPRCRPPTNPTPVGPIAARMTMPTASLTASTCRCAGPTWTPTATSTTCSSCACSRTRGSRGSSGGSARTAALLDEGVLVARHEIEYIAPLDLPPRADRHARCGARRSAAPGSTWATTSATPSEVGSGHYARAETSLVLYDFAGSRPRRIRADEKDILSGHRGDPVPFRWRGR